MWAGGAGGKEWIQGIRQRGAPGEMGGRVAGSGGKREAGLEVSAEVEGASLG